MKKNSLEIKNFDIINWKIKSTEKGKWMLKRLFSNLLPYHIWDKRTIKDEFAYSILFELSNGKKRFTTTGSDISYEEYLLSDCSESSYEIFKILSNAKRATIDRFFQKELNRKRRMEKDRKIEFEKKYGKLSNDEKQFIKKNRLSKINRYKNKYEIGDLSDNVSYGGLSENVSIHQRNMEIMDELIQRLKDTELVFLMEIMMMEPEVISKKQGIKTESVNRKIIRLREKVLSIIDESG
ncbi:hypothetical protein [Enterococcus casseliflavus]|uniref:hypothetical protein n=1 Tax=Enterococcus casseliflavus TaxID=37734 RepID=UPI00115EB4AD|nr:hypothetical protein [Enterococcus casseliflavus]